MRQLLPEPGEVDPADAYADARPRPGGRPWTVGLMASSADGAAAVDGRSGPLGGEGDRLVFRAVRAVADAVVVGAGTVRAEAYGPVRVAGPAAAARAARGQAPRPRLVVVSGRLDLDPGLRLFAEAEPDDPRPLVAHPPTAPAPAREALAGRAELLEIPGDATGIDPTALLAALGARGVAVAVVEGGPTLNGTLLDADLLDELCLTLDPAVVGGTSPRIAHGRGPAVLRAWRPAHLLTHDGALFWRLLRDRSGEG